MNCMEKKLATLTAEEDADWVRFFNWYCENGWTNDEADRLAWQDMQVQYERLQTFDGCLPDTSTE